MDLINYMVWCVIDNGVANCNILVCEVKKIIKYGNGIPLYNVNVSNNI